jgi:hypothetical protein
MRDIKRSEKGTRSELSGFFRSIVPAVIPIFLVAEKKQLKRIFPSIGAKRQH